MKKTNTEELYSKKVMLVDKLIDLNKKRITEADAISEGKKLNLSPSTSCLAWNNFVQTGGKIDLRLKYGQYKGATQFAQRKDRGGATNKNVTSVLAGQLIKKFMHSNLSVGKFCTNEKISISQYYSWVKELNVSGTLLGRKVLNPAKYAKLDVKTAIWMVKYPKTTKKDIVNMHRTEAKAYKRVIQVLEKYL